MINDVEDFFMFLLAICIPSLEKCLFSFSACFWLGFYLFFKFFLVLSCMSSLYVLDINPLSVISFANILSHFVGGCLFVLLIVSFSMQML